LTNYKALLEAVDVPSYNTILYGDSYKKDIESDFVSMQSSYDFSDSNGEIVHLVRMYKSDDPFGLGTLPMTEMF
jgi:hypothetical protein